MTSARRCAPALFLAAALLPAWAVLPAQVLPGDTQPRPGAKLPPAVSYLFPEQITVVADKPSAVDLHFKVAPGLHIQSHTPTEPELIPTTLNVPESSGVRLASAEFPQGSPYSFPTQPDQKLSVYQGEFIVHAKLVAAKGNHLIQGTLHYQACSNEICLPPRSIPVAIDVIAK
jgi:hypothetical protein